MNLSTSTQLTKLRLIYVPYILISISYVLTYSFLHWLLTIRFEILPLNDDIVNFWLPFTLIWIPVLIILRPRIKLLILKDNRGNLPFLYYFVAAATVAITTIIAQEYISTATGKLTQLQTIDQIINQPLTKYYKVKNYRIDKQHCGVYRRSETSGKNNEGLNFYIDVVCPITYLTSEPKAWLGTEYRKSLSNHASDIEKEDVFKRFNTETFHEFENDNLEKFIYLDRIGYSTKRKGFNSAIQTINGSASLPILEAKNEPFEARNGNKLNWTFGLFSIGAILLFIMVLIPKLSQPQLKKYINPESKKSFHISHLLKYFFTAKNTLFVTFFIIAINFLVFVLMVFLGLGFISFSGPDLLNWGANFRPLVDEGQWWRLITNVFLHGGLMHFIMNMYGLFFVAIFLEPLLGRLKYTLAYFICGIIASLTSIWWHQATVSIGASGAIFGLYGIFISLLLLNRANFASNKAILINILIFVVINLLLGLSGGIDNAAHIGGLLSGLILGGILYFFIEPPKPKRKYTRHKKTINILPNSSSTDHQDNG